ncbi:MAG: hypothetical protein M3179_02775 [Actinomycetota bacterium]|nr:hypothetical protein [Actinomycetota bacterium]
MASIGEVQLSINDKGEADVVVDVTYQIRFDSYDQHSNQAYVEVCRIMGDDTGTGDSPAAGDDDTLGFLTPLFLRSTQANGKPTLKRQFSKTFRKVDLNEDRGEIENPDEIRALVTLTPVAPSAVSRESNLVQRDL